MSKIVLPPLPDDLDPDEICAEFARARDLEVARVVLEAVADWIRTQRMVTPANGYEFASSIHAMEFGHEE